jgi:hypothetical protein
MDREAMRSTYILLMLGLPALAILNAVWWGSELQSFTKKVRSFESTAHIEQFKTVVAHQMYAALVQIVLLATPPIVFFVGLARRVLTPTDVLFIILPSALVIVVAAVYKKVETQARSIPASDDELRRQRDAIISTWIKKPFPNW